MFHSITIVLAGFGISAGLDRAAFGITETRSSIIHHIFLSYEPYQGRVRHARDLMASKVTSGNHGLYNAQDRGVLIGPGTVYEGMIVGKTAVKKILPSMYVKHSANTFFRATKRRRCLLDNELEMSGIQRAQMNCWNYPAALRLRKMTDKVKP